MLIDGVVIVPVPLILSTKNVIVVAVTAVTTTTITFLVDRINGTGTISVPVISIVGQPAPINIYTNGNSTTSANLIRYSTSTPGVTTGTAGDIWIQY